MKVTPTFLELLFNSSGAHLGKIPAGVKPAEGRTRRRTNQPGWVPGLNDLYCQAPVRGQIEVKGLAIWLGCPDVKGVET